MNCHSLCRSLNVFIRRVRLREPPRIRHCYLPRCHPDPPVPACTQVRSQDGEGSQPLNYIVSPESQTIHLFFGVSNRNFFSNLLPCSSRSLNHIDGVPIDSIHVSENNSFPRVKNGDLIFTRSKLIAPILHISTKQRDVVFLFTIFYS